MATVPNKNNLPLPLFSPVVSMPGWVDADNTNIVFQALDATSPIGGRLSLSSGVAITSADVAGATTLNLVASGSNSTAIFSGSDFVNRTFADNVAFALSTGQHGDGARYDVFDYWDGAAVKLCTGPLWASATSRGVGANTAELESVQGRLVNKYPMLVWNGTQTVALNARYATFRGTFKCSAAGQTEDSKTARFLSNYINSTKRPMSVSDGRESWVYSAATFVIAGGGNGFNRVRYLQCVSGRPIEVNAQSWCTNSTVTTREARVGIGIDQSTVDDSTFKNPLVLIDNLACTGSCSYEGDPGFGDHTLYWLEMGAGTDTQTWIGNRFDITSGLYAEVWN